ncbi:MAG TPA: serine hydrolase [Aggregatilineales bacterium]|nr:serine hydrolase [Aggregatilineales bacterium]
MSGIRLLNLFALVIELLHPTPSSATGLDQSFSILFPYPPNGDVALLHNAQVALGQMQAFFDRIPFKVGDTYSFDQDVLGGGLSSSLGYTDPGNGFGYGISIAASALNVLVHQATFWASDGTQRPIFRQVRAVPVKNDPALGIYGVDVYFSQSGIADYAWSLNADYHGPSPRISGTSDGSAITLSVAYANQSAPKLTRASLTQSLAALIGKQRIGVTVIPVAQPDAAIRVHDDDQTPIASAWKGPGLLYFLANVSPEVWRNLPIQYWKVQNGAEIPAQYQVIWRAYHDILYDVYIMAVFSGNHEAGNVLAYVYRALQANGKVDASSNAIRAFNDWSQQVVGSSAASGLYAWRYGDLEGGDIVDARYADRRLVVGGDLLFYANTYSAHDLALFYLYLARQGKAQGFYDPAVELLSIHNAIISKIEGQLPPGAQTANKPGYFGPGSPESLDHDVYNDAGLLILPDGRMYVVVFTAFDAVDLESDVVGLVIRDLADHPFTSLPRRTI